jgi:hypothetical protein
MEACIHHSLVDPTSSLTRGGGVSHRRKKRSTFYVLIQIFDLPWPSYRRARKPYRRTSEIKGATTTCQGPQWDVQGKRKGCGLGEVCMTLV